MAQESTIDLGQRRLAAIIFTDVVGFSARIQDDETGTLQLVERDTQFIKNICTSFNGRILKSTGDGLLIFFDSAVDAVAAALKIQEEFAQQKITALPQDVLEHRIGIHLGDVFIRDGDVMGDGVNIAARLQQEAEPGGICISQTVYEVVKNKLSLQVTSLGPRELKNIREAVPAYQVLLEAQKALDRPSDSQRSSWSPTDRRSWVPHVAAALLIGLVGAMWHVYKSQSSHPLTPPTEPTQQQREAKPSSSLTETPPVLSTQPPPAPTTSTMVEKPPVVSAPASPPASTIAPARPNPPAEETAPPPVAPAPPARALQMSARWIQGEMLRYNKSNPLKIQPPPRLATIATNMPPTTSWMEGTMLHFDVGGKDTPSDLSRAAPIVLEYVLYSLTQAVGQEKTPEPIRRIFGGGPPPGGSDSSGQQPPPMPPEGETGPGGPPQR